MIHRDIKPSNIWLAENGAAILGDFGIARTTDAPSITVEGAVMGTLAYMSPEQAVGESAVTFRADLYSLGATLFEMTCGRAPDEGASLVQLLRRLRLPPPDPRELNPAIPDAVADLIVRLLARRPEDRPASADDVRDELERLKSGDFKPPREPAPPVLAQALPTIARCSVASARWRGWTPRGSAPCEGRSRLFVVAGDAGIGKTRLAAAFALRVHDEGAVVLYGRCDKEPLIHYQPFVEALRYVVRHSPGRWQRLDPELAPELGWIARLVPELRGRVPEPEDTVTIAPEVQRYRLYEAAIGLLNAAMGSHPMLLIIDDLQWADRATASLLGHFIREAQDRPLMILATLRSAGAGPNLGLEDDHPIIALRDRLRGDPLVDSGRARAADPRRPRRGRDARR